MDALYSSLSYFKEIRLRTEGLLVDLRAFRPCKCLIADQHFQLVN